MIELIQALPEAEPAYLVGAAALLAGTLHLLAARWRDIAVLAIGLSSMALLMLGRPPLGLEWAGLGGVLLLVVLAWIRGWRAGVGHPWLGLMAVVVGGAAATLWLWWPLLPVWVPVIRAADVAMPLLVLLTLVGTALALERPAPRRMQVVVRRRVPVEGA